MVDFDGTAAVKVAEDSIVDHAMCCGVVVLQALAHASRSKMSSQLLPEESLPGLGKMHMWKEVLTVFEIVTVVGCKFELVIRTGTPCSAFVVVIVYTPENSRDVAEGSRYTVAAVRECDLRRKHQGS